MAQSNVNQVLYKISDMYSELETLTQEHLATIPDYKNLTLEERRALNNLSLTNLSNFLSTASHRRVNSRACADHH